MGAQSGTAQMGSNALIKGPEPVSPKDCVAFAAAKWQKKQRLPIHPIHKAVAKGDARLETALQTKMLCRGTVCPHLNERLCTHFEEKQPTFMQITPMVEKKAFNS